MKLKTYIRSKKMTPAEFGKLMGASEGGVVKWIHETRIPRPKQMLQIAELTGGLVMPNDFYFPENENKGIEK